MNHEFNDDDELDDRDAFEAFADVIAEVKAAGEVPEPSPLFWNQLSARVREAVAGEPLPRSWWAQYWRPMVLVFGSAAAVALAVVLRGPFESAPAAPGAAVASAASHSPDPAADAEVGEMWQLIEGAAPNVELSAAQESDLMPTRYATDQAIQSLTPAEREALVRLLRKEMGASE